ncbi:MAG: P-II family nitrogen regulator [Myxococcaceae bacterium]
MKEIKAIIQPFKLSEVIDALQALSHVGGITVLDVQGFGRERDAFGVEVPAEGSVHHLHKKMLLMVVRDTDAALVVSTIEQHAHTGNAGDGKVFVSATEEAVRLRTGERGDVAL